MSDSVAARFAAAMINVDDKGPVWSRRQPGINALDASSALGCTRQWLNAVCSRELRV